MNECENRVNDLFMFCTVKKLTPCCVLREVKGGLPKHENTKHRPVEPLCRPKTTTTHTGPLCRPQTQKHKTQALAARPKHENTENNNAPGMLIASDCV